MRPCVFIHTNHKQMIGALVSRHSVLRNSRHADRFDVRIIDAADHSFLREREGQPFLRDGSTRIWRYEDLQSFTPLRFMPPELMGYKGQFAILSAASTATNQNAWIKYMKLELKKPAYKNMQLVKIYYGNDNPAQSLQATEAMLQAYPNLKGIESPTTVGISSAAQYLSTSKYKGKVVLQGLGLPSQMKKYLLNDTLKDFALWNPENLGYLAAYAAAAISSGDIKGKVGESFKAGKLGTYKILKGPDGRPQVILGPPFVFTIKNVDKFKF